MFSILQSYKSTIEFGYLVSSFLFVRSQFIATNFLLSMIFFNHDCTGTKIWSCGTSGGARSRNLRGGGEFQGQHAFWGGQDRISRNLPSPSLPKFLTPWIFFHTFFSEIFSRTFRIFFQAFQNCPDLPKFFTDLPKIFPRPTKM